VRQAGAQPVRAPQAAARAADKPDRPLAAVAAGAVAARLCRQGSIAR
jgi:hypothetical protein